MKSGGTPVPVAVVGAACRLPGDIERLDDLWSALRDGVDAVTQSPDAPWRRETSMLFRADPGSPAVPCRGAFLGDVYGFDAGFFGISPREAANIDPQQRILLETCWRSLEHANIAADSLARSATGVFIGLGSDDYAQLASAPERAERLDAYSITGVNRAMAAGRVAYLLRAHGPAVTLDTTCSSSLVAVHMAAQSLRSGECDLALAAGCQLVRTPWSITTRGLTNALSPTGICRAFDAEADGFVLGEGAGSVVLKRLDDALRDGDPVLGVIHGSAINHDGPSSGLTAPNGRAQELVIRSALRMARMSAAEIGYVEAHGTGTSLGDPIEAEALGAVYGSARTADRPLVIGSVKTNFGHLEAASGILSLLKAVLVVDRGEIPATLHHRIPNPHIDWDRSNLRVQTAHGPWAEDGLPRAAGVSAFGLSGTNCHVVVGELPAGRRRPRGAALPPAASGAPNVVVLSAKDEDALRTAARQYADAWEESSASQADVCASGALGRSAFRSRLAFVAEDAGTARESLRQFARTGSAAGVCVGTLSGRPPRPPVVLLLPGGGSAVPFPQELHGGVEAFRRAVNRVAEAADLAGVGRAALFDGGNRALAAFAARYAVGCMWAAWGLTPDLIVADPDTEQVARCLAGQVSVEAAVAALDGRARGTADLDTGARGTVGTDAEVRVCRPTANCTASVADEAASLASRSACTFLQAGGSPALAARIAASAADGTWVGTALTCEEDTTVRGALAVLPDLFVLGRAVDWTGVHHGDRSVRLPGHPFRRNRLWLPGMPDPETVAPVTATTVTAQGAQDRLETRMDDGMAEVEAFLRGELAQLLGMPAASVAEDVPLLELGADSLVFARIVQRVAERFDVTLTVRELFEDLLTIEEIARHVASAAGPAVAPAEVERVAAPTPAATPAPSPVAGTLAVSADTAATIEALQAHVRSLSAELTELQARSAVPTAPIARAGDHAAVGDEQSAAARPEPVAARPPAARRADYIADVVTRYRARTAASREYALRNQDRLANNRRFAPPVRPETQEIRYPICGERSAGSRMTDADGSEYIDLSMGFGAQLLGHSPDVVTRALADQLRSGIQLGSASRTAGDVAELITELTGAERMTFCTSGTEAVMTAIRLARAATGRSKVVLFSKSYHGHFDGTLVSSRPDDLAGAADPMVVGTTQAMVDDVIVLPLDRDSSLLTIAERASEIAAVVVEPVQNGNPGVHPAEFLRQLRGITREAGVALVFDEILTGFRIRPGGCQEYFGIQADLVTYGKTLAAGLPMAAVAGRREFLDLIDGGSWVGERHVPADRKLSYTAGTYANHPLAMAAARAVLEHLVERGPLLHKELNERSDAMIGQLNAGFAELGVPLGVANLGSFFRFAQNSNFSFVHQPVEMDLFRANLALRGVYVAESGASFLSTAHTDTDADRVVGAALDAAAEMRDAGLWPSLSQRAAAVRTREREQPGTDQASTERPLSELPRAAAPRRTPALSLSYFGDSTNIDIDDHYQLLLDGAEFADRHEFEAVWFPERHFHSFGGFSPNPAILASALAQRTERVALRAGSVVAPLHHPARIAEEWAMVDRMSGGRVGMAFASGWNDRDFVLAPGTFADRRDTTMRRVEEVRRLWRGEELEYPGGGEGGRIRVATFPRPVQRELPVWLTTLGSAAAFAAAGRAGTGVLTNLLHQDITELGGKIAQYRAARARAGHDAGHVTVLLHTLVGDDRERVRAAAAEPLQDYLSAALDLTNRMSPTERRIDPERLADSDREYLLQSARDKYIQQRSLIGGIEDCRATVAALADAGVDEIACFVDFGVSSELARTGLEALDRLRRDLTAPEPRSARPSVRLVPAPRAETVAGSETEADTVLPTTPNQRLVWAAAQFGPEASSAYNLRRLLRLTGDLDTDALRAAFRALVGRHEALRVAFSADGTEQRVREHPGIDLDQVDLSGPDEQQRGSELATLLADEAGRPFDLAHGPLIRGSLIRVDGREHLLCLTVHHVAVDGTAENVLLEELGRLYERELGAGEPLPAPPRLVDHVRGPVSDPPPAAALEYWRQRFSPLPAPLALTRAARPRVAGHAGGRLHFDFDAQLLHSVQKFGAEHGASPFMVVLAAYTLLLHRVAEQDDVVVGVPVSRRSAEGPDRDLVAYCANLLPIRSTGAPSVGFPAHLTQIRRSLLDAFDHETCSLADIMAALPKREVWGRPSVVSAVFSWDRPVVPRLPGITVAHVESVAPAVRFDLGLNVTHLDSGHRISWDYNAGLFDEDEVRRLHARFEELLRAAVGAAVPDDATTTVLELVDRFATERPDAIAVHGGTAPLGIGMAVERARTVAARLVAQGVRTGDRVGLAVEPGPGLLVGLLGILWSGGRCVPLGTVGDRSQPYPAVAVSDRVPRPDLPDVAVLDLDAWTAGPLPELPDVGAGVMALELGGSETLRHGQLGRAVAEAASTQAAGVLTNLEPAMVKPGSWIDLLAAAVGGPSVHWADSTQGTDTRTTEAEPSTGSDIVGELIAIWSQILERTGLTAESDFFEEGGDSIRAVQILSRIRTRFDRELPVDTFFDAPTIGDLAKRVATP